MATADEILSLAEVKRHLFLPPEAGSQDVLLTSYRDAAIKDIESRSGRHLLDKTISLEVPVRYVPLSTAPFRLSDLVVVEEIEYYDEDTEYWNDAGWDNLSVYWGYDDAAGFIWPGGYQQANYPTEGLRVHRTEAETTPELSSRAVRYERIGHKENLWRVWPNASAWDRIHPYLPVILTCKVGIASSEVAPFKVACLPYVRYLWSQMPEFKESTTIDLLLRGKVYTNIDTEAQRVIEIQEGI